MRVELPLSYPAVPPIVMADLPEPFMLTQDDPGRDWSQDEPPTMAAAYSLKAAVRQWQEVCVTACVRRGEWV